MRTGTGRAVELSLELCQPRMRGLSARSSGDVNEKGNGAGSIREAFGGFLKSVARTCAVI